MFKKSLDFKLIIVSTVVVATALLYFFNDARYSGFLLKCPFYSFTGLYCPGCGSQRAISSLLHADFISAIKFNILLVACLPLLLYSAIVTVVNAFGKNPIEQKLFYSPVFVRLVLIIVILFAIFRNIPVSPFTFLAPHS